MVRQQRFPATHEGLVDCAAFLEEAHASPKPSIVADEICSNIVRCSGATAFTVGLSESGDELTLVFTDDGKAFDPTAMPDPDVTARIEDRPIGGLGLFMVRKMSRSVSYRRIGNENELTVVMHV